MNKSIKLLTIAMLTLAVVALGEQTYRTVSYGHGSPFKQSFVNDNDGVFSTVGVSRSFELAVSMGQADGYSFIDKFGANYYITTTTDPEDIWEGGGTYTYDDDGTAPIVSVASDSTSDDQEIIITGLTIDGIETNQTVTLSGTNRVAITVGLWRVYRVRNDGTNSLDGTVFVYTGTGAVPSVGDSEVRAVVDNGNNQTLMAIYTVPLGKVGFLHRGEIGMELTGNASVGTDYARVYYQSRRYGKVFRVKKSVSVMSVAQSSFSDVRSFPDPIPALTDIKLTVAEVSGDMGAWGTFDILLVDEAKFSTEYLQAIGQPNY